VDAQQITLSVVPTANQIQVSCLIQQTVALSRFSLANQTLTAAEPVESLLSLESAAAVKTKKTGYATRSAVMDTKDTAPFVGVVLTHRQLAAQAKYCAVRVN
jgi:hypothetical protein